MSSTDRSLPPDRTTVSAVIVAGGLGRRMSADGSGVDKGLLQLRGRAMVAHVIERIASQVSTVIINADPSSASWQSFGLPVIADIIEGRLGPLAGIHAAMKHVQTPWLLAVPCDTPALPHDLLPRLARAQQRTQADRVCARTAGQLHPATLLVRSELEPSLRIYLEQGGRKIETWLEAGAWAQADFEDEQAFLNVNTPQQLQQLEQNA